MFLILPYKTELRLGKWPVVTYTIIVLCLVIHYLQVDNRDKINAAAKTYCSIIHLADAEKNVLDYLTIDKEDCEMDLSGFYSIDNPDRIRILFEKYNKKHKEYSNDELIHVVDIFKEHLIKFRKVTPISWDRILSYDPSSWNPFSMLLSALSHGDWGHVIFNLIFFYAFTPALELLTRSPWRFTLSLVIIEIACDIPYSIYSIFTDYPVPTLGLSGVVMGMIGLSAYMMPWAKIKTIFWFLYYIRILTLPAWFLALWYIGGDTYDLLTSEEHGGVNVLAHVFGGFAGYFTGLLLFNELRSINDSELKDEIDYMRAKQQDFFSLVSSYKANNGYWESKQNAYNAKRDEGRRRDIIYKYITVGQDSKAINLILDDYHLKAPSIELFEELFFTIKDWKQGRAFYCLGRLIIGHHINNQHFGAAIRFAKLCYDSDSEFVLANSAHVLLLSKECMKHKDDNLAYLIIKNANYRYHNTLDVKTYQDMELLLNEI